MLEHIKGSEFFFDFDNTITTSDVLDDIIKRFSVNRDWVSLEKAWTEGKIGSEKCLEGQLKFVKVSKRDLRIYLSQVKIDNYFKRLLGWLRSEGIKPVIVSDSFSFLIRSILTHNGVSGIKVYANDLRFEKDGLIPSFPHKARSCADCANCKKMHLMQHTGGKKKSVYVGDGLSDICPAEHADLVFAKGRLLEYLKKKKINCVQYKDLGDVFAYLKGGRSWNKKIRRATPESA